ncbi:MAG: aminotransferase class III-fold pyridoxal phosphate-dependent enzyme [Acidobacteriaceae bacterium]|nr:aminotransferase class III-fold pyridoxal phosphate-dependent enzyme [Acidobacteriaceae bacterium]
MAEILSSQQVVDITKQHNFGTWRRGKQWNPLHVVSGDGCWFTDANGKRYLDFSAQLMCVNLGYNNQAVIQSIQQQAAELAYIQPSYTTTARAEVSQLLLEILPKGLTKFFFCTSGTDANEAAFKIARMYTGKTKIIGRYRSYHGSTASSIGATGDARRWPSEPRSKLPGVVFSPEVNCYKCPLKHSYPDCGIACADYLEYMIQNEGDVAAVLAETVVGTNGVLIPPPGYYQKLRRICDENNVLLIADEVMAGWGRTGKWFAIDHWGVQPDILTTAKGITSAYVPLGLTAVSEKISAFFEDNLFAHGHTYEAHPLTLGPAIATIREMQRLNLVERAVEVGAYLGEKLQMLKAKHKAIGDVRGLGLFWAVELVKDQAKKTPFNVWQEKLDGKTLVVDQIAGKMMASGIFLQAWMNHFVIAPPLIVSKEEIDFALTALDEHLAIADQLVAG